MVIYKDTTNYLDFSGFEAGVLVNPYYLFEFIKDDNKSKTYCIGVDFSTNKVKHNLCTIDEGSTTIPLSSQVNLAEGFYILNIYEQANGSTNLDPTGLTKVESKILRVIATVVPTQKAYDGYTKTQNVYNG